MANRNTWSVIASVKLEIRGDGAEIEIKQMRHPFDNSVNWYSVFVGGYRVTEPMSYDGCEVQFDACMANNG